MSKDRKDCYDVTDHIREEEVSGSVRSVMIPMRDGVKLHAKIYLPNHLDKPAPVILVASPYNRKENNQPGEEIKLKRGQIQINLSWRGTEWSEDDFLPTRHAATTDITDMEDFFSWLEKQEFFNGRCVMNGASYPGYTQWCAMKTFHPCLKGTAPHVAPVTSCRTTARPNGGTYIGTLGWAITMHHRTLFGYENVPDFNKLKFSYHLPLLEADEYVYGPGAKSPCYREYLSSCHAPAEALKGSWDGFDSFTVPAFISGGWFDPFKQEVIESFQRMKRSCATAHAQKYTRLLMGPWTHGGLTEPEVFGAENDQTQLGELRLKFLKNLLEDPMKDPLHDYPFTVRFFMTGENAWHDAADWPPENTREYKLFLHAGGKLDTNRPQTDEQADSYISDPNDPVSATQGLLGLKGCVDRTFLENRSDMLTYTTETFTSAMAFTGNFKLRFYASASTVDTDFFATLTLVTPEGKSLMLTFGMIRARYRNGVEKEEFLTPGKIYPFEIDMGDMAVKVLPGYALRLEIAGQEFPYYDRNANTGSKPGTDAVLLPSTHTIYHDHEHTAELILPFNGTFTSAE